MGGGGADSLAESSGSHFFLGGGGGDFGCICSMLGSDGEVILIGAAVIGANPTKCEVAAVQSTKILQDYG